MRCSTRFICTADFPNHTPWSCDWAKYTDEGWYGNAAIRAHLFGNWYLPGDFNPAPAVPVWPFLEWVLFFFTGVTIEAARGLAVGFFFLNLLLSYLLLRARGARWMALLALDVDCHQSVSLLLQPAGHSGADADRAHAGGPESCRPPAALSPAGGCFGGYRAALYADDAHQDDSRSFCLPALGWAMVLPLWKQWRLMARCTLTAAGTFATVFGGLDGAGRPLWLLPRLQILFLRESLREAKGVLLAADQFLVVVARRAVGGPSSVPLAGLVVLGAILAFLLRKPARAAAQSLLLNPVFGASVLTVAGYILFMTIQNHTQPRYFAVVAFFSFFLVAQGAEAMAACDGRLRWLGAGMIAVIAVAAGFNGVQTLSYAAHPEYSFVNAAQRLAQYIDSHPNGRRLLVSISGDQITLATHLPALCDDFGTPSSSFPDLPTKLAYYQPGWWATWNDIDPGTLEDLHTLYSIEQVASFRAFDDPDRNVLVLFKLHPLPGGQTRDFGGGSLKVPLPGDKIEIPLQ